MGDDRPSVPKDGVSNDIADFLEKAASLSPRARPQGAGPGRLAVILDATASRERTWDAAVQIQAEMFDAAAALGGLAVELVFYRGLGECRSSGWVDAPETLARKLEAVRCRAGRTQIERALDHVLVEAERAPVDAFVFVGDAFEESLDLAADVAGKLGLRGVKGFFFLEGRDPTAARAFSELAALTGGAFHPFDLTSPNILKELLGAVAAYAAGGRRALEDYARSGSAGARAVAAALPAPRDTDA